MPERSPSSLSRRESGAAKEARERPGWLERAQTEGIDEVLEVIDGRIGYLRDKRGTDEGLRRLRAHRSAVKALRP